MSKKVLLLNGPNLNLLGERNVEIYGKDTLADVESRLAKTAKVAGYELTAFQSNSEGALIDSIQASRSSHAGLLINPGAFSHTSIAIRDALECFPGPILEVHISNIFRREPFRRHSYVSEVAQGVVCGLGPKGYDAALEALICLLGK